MITKNDTVKVEGWRGKYKVEGNPFYNSTFGHYVLPVTTSEGNTMRVFLDECTKVASKPENKPWYLAFSSGRAFQEDIKLESVNIDQSKLADALGRHPASGLARVQGSIYNPRRDTKTSFTINIDYDGKKLFPQETYRDKAKMGYILSLVRERLLKD
jgi:hypothetical protein